MNTERIGIALRPYIPSKTRKHATQETHNENRPVLVLDTETTEDEYQNLIFGACGIWVSGYLHRFILFHARNLGKRDIETLRAYAETETVEGKHVEVMSVDKFITTIFYPWILDAQALCAGFNLAFDLSRLAVRFAYGRGKWRNGFTFQLTNDPEYPRVRIRSLDSVRSFFALAPTKYSGPVRGHFLDLRALGFALTDEKLTLEKACQLFDTHHRKLKVKTHGKFNSTYVRYNVNDTLATYDLYVKMAERLREFKLGIPSEKAFSPASLGKAYLRRMGIKPFLEMNPEFPPELLGYVMTTYFGGRCEVRIRKKPVKVRLMDFKSMYPTIFILMDLWKFLTAERITYFDSTEETKELVSKIRLPSLTDPSLYPKLVTIVKIQPEDNIVPARAHYGEDKNVYNIGINYVTSQIPLWYTLPDVIASMLLTGRAPKILRAISFRPQGFQRDLKPIEVPGGITIAPETNFIKSLIEYRKRIQEKRDDAKDRAQRERFNVIQNQLKILANATSYGIFIEVITEDKPTAVRAYGLSTFDAKVKKTEEFGEFFNPILATMITSGARLMLAIAEAWLEQHGGYYAFCDTDSMAVSPFHWKPLRTFFQSLNPYDSADPILKLEHDERDTNGNLLNLWFYGISAKRYVLYRMRDNDPVLVKDGWSSHGLGHLLHGNRENEEAREKWEQKLWIKILHAAKGDISEKELSDGYSGEYAVSKYAVTTPSLHRRLKTINGHNPYSKQIKPFNFVLIGQPTEMNDGKLIHPITKFTGRTEEAPFQPFIDYNMCQRYSRGTELYWKTLQSVIHDYLNHSERKFKNGWENGNLRRWKLKVRNLAYIGKETNEIEETEILAINENSYIEYS